MLQTRRQELAVQIRHRLKDVQIAGSSQRERPDPEGDVECEGQEDVDLALMQMASQLLRRIDAALVRVDLGTYGRCVECESDIAGARLKALPFAARCTNCEAAIEARQNRAPGVRSRLALSLDTVE